MKDAVSLCSLSEGQKATIVSIAIQGEMGRRMRDMGLVPGASVELIGRAPLKDPLALRILGFTLTLRNTEAGYILVSPDNALDA